MINASDLQNYQFESFGSSSLPTFRFSALSFDLSRKGVIYYGGSSGTTGNNYLFRTTDTGITWEQLGENVFKSEPVEIIVHPTDPSKLFVATQDGVYRSLDSGYNWRFSNTGFERKAITSLVIDSANPHILFATSICNSLFYDAPENESRGGVYQSTDSGETWDRITDEALSNWNVTEIRLLQNPRRLIAGTQCGAYEFILPPTTQVKETSAIPSTDCTLLQNYPNPFNPLTQITYKLGKTCPVKLEILDLFGRILEI